MQISYIANSGPTVMLLLVFSNDIGPESCGHGPITVFIFLSSNAYPPLTAVQQL